MRHSRTFAIGRNIRCDDILFSHLFENGHDESDETGNA